MSRQIWNVWFLAIGVWIVAMGWLAGYSSGYDQGHIEGWDTARKALAEPYALAQTVDLGSHAGGLIQDGAR